VVRLPNGKRVNRRLLFQTTVQVVLDFIESNLVDDQYIERFSVCTNFPKRSLLEMNTTDTIENVFRGSKGEIIFVDSE